MKGHHGHRTKHAGSHKHNSHGKHKPSAKQIAAEKKWQSAGAHAKRHVHTVGQHHEHAKASKWSPGVDVASCAAEALAASLRLTGRQVSDADVLALYCRTARHEDAGATLAATLEAAATHGLAGVLLADARPADALLTGVIAALDLEQRHAMVVDGHGVWTWGQWRPVSCGLLTAVDEAWEVTWQ